MAEGNNVCILTIGRALSTVARWKGCATAITATGRGQLKQTLTFTELDLESNRLARSYEFFGVQRNDLVTVMLPTGPEFVIACFATWKLGATPNNVNIALTFHERDGIVQLACPRIIVGVPSLKDPNMRLHEGVRCIPEGFQPGPMLSMALLPDAFSNNWLVACSGGSTGRPKLIVLADASFVNMIDIGGGRLAMSDGLSMDGGGVHNGVELVPSPISHNAPFHCAIHGLLSGCHEILMTKFDPEMMLRLIQDYSCTFSYAVPTIMKRIWDLPEQTRLRYDVSSLRGIFHMAAPCPPWLKEAWCHWLGPEKVWELYGPTEAMACTRLRGDDWLSVPKHVGLNCVGRCSWGEIRILNPETQEVLPSGSIGEVWMRHHQRRITYFYRGGKTERDEEGWETVGDIGMLDDNGYVHLGDRKTDMVLIGGANVYPAEVEAALEEHSSVKSAVAVGLPDEDLGNVLHGVVYTGDDNISEEELLGYLKQRLAPAKVPRGISFAQQHLRGDDGKVRRSEVAAWVAQQIVGQKPIDTFHQDAPSEMILAKL